MRPRSGLVSMRFKMSAIWRSLAKRCNSTLFSSASLSDKKSNLLYIAAKRTEVAAAAFYSCFPQQRRENEQRKPQSKLSFTSWIPNVGLSNSISTSPRLDKYYVKPNYLKKWGRRDFKRRQMFKEYEVERSSLRMIKKSDILPSGVREKAAADLQKLPLNSSITRVRNRCVLTDRPRGIVGRFRVSRMMFRYYAEKGLIAGVHKAQW